ncbi:uncharacterized protein CDAR_255351 [Caerostris darwini]|uniref:Reverse transcriptase/retrotransposon-derived protein RNase H-like domain-containing protein n=1 Tax=Caerostris darwini TaxID=1538125 RepID=A0AAV4V1R4_9ARAC|nr:uncharacterized protein CDAR_255351 [Caerostris darwini]
MLISIAHRLFDPFGVASTVMVCPKLMLQETWKMSLGWDEEIKGILREEFIRWFNYLKALKQIYLPRWIKVTPEIFDNVFCDASKDAYAAVAYLVFHGECNVPTIF